MRARRSLSIAAVIAASVGAVMSSPGLAAEASSPGLAAEASHQSPARSAAPRLIGGYKHLVVIYEENHSFDNLYGSWGSVGRARVDGLSRASATAKTQLAQDGTPFACLLQNDVNLTSPPLANSCADAPHGVPASAFANSPFVIDGYIGADDKTCPAPGVFAATGVLKNSAGALPGGCTRDLVHRFYQEKFQINGGRQNRYVTGSDAVGLTMGVYDTKQLPIYRYLHSAGAPNYVIADRFFQAANGGSFLNHQYLIAARAPYDSSHGALGAANSVLDANGMPTSYPLYTATGTVADKQLTVACAGPSTMDYTAACGDIAVNTVQPYSAPFGSGAKIAPVDDSAFPNIGDRLSAKGISWAWYSGGWDAAEAGTPGPLFQYHHQPFNYFANYAKGTPGRAHLQDETTFLAAAASGDLPTVSFVKPYGAENEHPGYASEPDGSDHLVDLLKAVTSGPDAESTLVVVTYDEFGGQWDHVAPPGAGSTTKGVYDAWGPGTRIPALVLSASMRRSTVDHTVYDTTSILATIERSFGLAPLSPRDAAVNDLSAAIASGRGGPARR